MDDSGDVCDGSLCYLRWQITCCHATSPYGNIRQFFLTPVADTSLCDPPCRGTTLTEDLSILTRPATSPDQVLAYGAESDQVVDIRFGGHRAAHRPLLVLLHGGFWRPKYDRAESASMAAALASEGWTVATAEYRRIPGDPDSTLHDIATVIEDLASAVMQHNGRIILIGNSAGGYLALWAAAAYTGPGLYGILALAPIADLRLAHEQNLGSGAVVDFLGAAPIDRSDIDSCQLDSPAVPVTIVHGEEDATVPLVISESYLAIHPKTRLVRLKDIGHFALIDPISKAWSTVVEELRQLSNYEQGSSMGR